MVAESALVFITTVTTIYKDIYHESSGIVGLHYIAPVGCSAAFMHTQPHRNVLYEGDRIDTGKSDYSTAPGHCIQLEKGQESRHRKAGISYLYALPLETLLFVN